MSLLKVYRCENMTVQISSRILSFVSIPKTGKIVSARGMSSTAKVWVDKNTRVICQGFTGKQVSNFNIFFIPCMSAIELPF